MAILKRGYKGHGVAMKWMTILLVSLMTVSCSAQGVEYETIIVGSGGEQKWSPDGKYLSFISWPDGKGVLKVWEVATGETRTIGPAPTHKYEWFSNDKFIFDDHSYNGTTDQMTEIYSTLSLNGTVDTLFTRTESFKNGTRGRLVKLSDGQVIVGTPERTDVKMLASKLALASIDTSGFFVVNNDPKWRELWGQTKLDGDLYLVKPDGSMYKRITVDQGYILPSLSPDGQYICGRGGGATIFNHKGEIVGKIKGAEAPQFLPDSKRLIYFRCTYVGDPGSFGEADIYLAEYNGENELQITNTPDLVEIAPEISPDCSMIACTIESQGVAVLRLKERL